MELAYKYVQVIQAAIYCGGKCANSRSKQSVRCVDARMDTVWPVTVVYL